jgi:hypothetical protein
MKDYIKRDVFEDWTRDGERKELRIIEREVDLSAAVRYLLRANQSYGSNVS